ncbi:disulfide bond formation protein DsbB [Vibrio ulleungensis]|uniref:Disulfide bond formation protein B n=1 Tax=Vibrio ulleungensis TaxID=2807619 RepID=A0ABS2HKM1_9VIBR|nr:disulfide bond formation protein DsbB [Vibrio ulleungensis]MBM7036662.1 disulfide bond formation protein DsbB [Vibrio ulleungensis]
MKLLTIINQFSKTRLAWSLLLICILIFELCALGFQHIMELPPCVMCIYERVAMFGIAGAAIIGLFNPKNPVIRWVGLAAWGYTAWQGLALSLEHVDYQFNPSPFKTCDLFVVFPEWAPLNQWMPWLFEAYGDCSKIVWQFIGLSMPQWLVVIFAGNLIALGIIVIAQFFPKKA